MRTQTVMESANVVVDDLKDLSEFSTEEQIEDLLEKPAAEEKEPDEATEAVSRLLCRNLLLQKISTTKESEHSSNSITDPIQREPSSRVKKNHPSDLILGNLDESMVTRRKYANIIQFLCFISSLEPKSVKEALMDEDWFLSYAG
ncbi:hypothetical protein AMTR_s01778p00002700 [Amborella trichopoda]|uniref:Uncharacterized protein n=1 Tax=Amborella trichopoda TaxID=13333 RepID=W1NSU2_AMBTC|nr:hypothetical protein AMTR_s01778p00002700 [Amborella trichopoda]